MSSHCTAFFYLFRVLAWARRVEEYSHVASLWKYLNCQNVIWCVCMCVWTQEYICTWSSFFKIVLSFCLYWRKAGYREQNWYWKNNVFPSLVVLCIKKKKESQHEVFLTCYAINAVSIGVKGGKYESALLKFYLELNIESAANSRIKVSKCENGDRVFFF